jgi:molecular chaperone GrpE
VREREPAPSTPAAEELRDASEQAEDLPPVDEATALRAALEALQRQHEEVVQERQALHDRYLRLAAEFDNFRKRNAREWQEQRQRAAAEVLRAVLEIADNLERALQAPAADAQGLRGGVELIRQQLQALLQRFGIACIEAQGLPFDPARHEAVLLVESEGVESQHVVDVVQQGYTLHGEILRPARVTVSR